LLRSLHETMMSFYAEKGERSCYQDMLNEKNVSVDDNSSTAAISQYITNQSPSQIVEVGCGSARLYRLLRRQGFNGSYTGIEVAHHVIERNCSRNPDAEWETADSYNLPLADEDTDMVCAEFVLEHLVYPEKGLREMLRIVRPGGCLVLIFPDFVAAGRLGSQMLGFSLSRTAKNSLKDGHWIDACVSLYDSRIRLPRALENVHEQVGPFPVNTRPLCLTYRDKMFADIDATYISSKWEVRRWAEKKGMEVTYPRGTDGQYQEVAFLSISK